MAEKTFKDRIAFHPSLETLEVDFSNVTFSSVDEVDAFYNEVDQQLAKTGRRWYFLINYLDCVIEPQVTYWAALSMRLG